MSETVVLTPEAKAALRHKGPSTDQLKKMLLSNEEDDMPSSRHVRWMAAQLLIQRGVEVPGANANHHF